MSDRRETPGWLLRRPIAHRGLFCNPNVPENSLAAFAMASQAGTPIEFDVRPLADGQVVVFHDEDTERMTGTAGRVEALTAADCRLRRLLGTDEHIPLLTEALTCVSGSVPLLIEIKVSGPEVDRVTSASLACLRDYPGEFALQSFSPAVLQFLRQNAPAICRGQLSSGNVGVPVRQLTQPDFIGYHIGSLPHRGVSRLRSSGMPLLAWTIRSAEGRERAARLADNYIFETDQPLEEYFADTEGVR